MDVFKANLKGDFVKNLPERMKRFENMLANKHFFAGAKVGLFQFDIRGLYKSVTLSWICE